MNWQLIETAPKDGTEVILHFPTFRTTAVIGRFNSTERLEFGKSVQKSEYWSHGLIVRGPTPEPTHWMPIPDGPR